MAPQIDDAPADLGGITPPAHIPQVGDAEPWPPAQRWATVTALPNADDTGPIEPVSDAAEDAPSAEPEPAPSPRPEFQASPPAPQMVRMAAVQRERPVAAPPPPADAGRAAPSSSPAGPTASPAPAPATQSPASPGHCAGPAVAQPGFWSRVGEFARGLLGFGDRGTGDEYVPGASVLALGVLTGLVATAAFTLSFQMILPVVTAAGWTAPIAYLGPVVIDITEVAAAIMGVLANRADFIRTGRQFLIMATFLSIVLNLAGHQVRASSPGAIHSSVPPGWTWAIELFSVMVPVILAINIHLFGTAFSAWLAQRRRAKDKQQRRQSQNSGAKAASPAAPSPTPSSAAGQQIRAKSPEETLLAEIVAHGLKTSQGYRNARRAFEDPADRPAQLRQVTLPTEGRVKSALAEARKRAA